MKYGTAENATTASAVSSTKAHPTRRLAGETGVATGAVLTGSMRRVTPVTVGTRRPRGQGADPRMTRA
nr:hypothetical protein GCM10025699_15590 [Microbacterium flavescens]